MAKNYYIPSTWEEMNTAMFVRVSEALFCSSGLSVPQTRANVLSAITGIKITSEVNCHQELASLTRFCFIISHNADILEIIDSELTNLLAWCLPSEIDDARLKLQLQHVAGMLETKASLNLKIRSNKIPSIAGLRGPVFSIDKNGILETDLLTGEYLDSLEYLAAYEQSKDEKYLANATACLYRENRKKYSTFEAQQQAVMFYGLPEVKAVWLMMLAWQHYFTTHPIFSVLYSGNSSETSNKITAGISELIYQFSKEGYGTIDDLMHMPIVDFLNIRVKSLRDYIYQLRANNKKDSEIADILKLDIQTVFKF